MRKLECPDELTGVFLIMREIPEIGAMVGDRIVLAPHDPDWPFALTRQLSPAQARWAFDPRTCALEFTDPSLMKGLALRHLEAAVPASEYAPHLRLVD